MIVEKIFSEIDSQEKIYSVLMTEDEIALFSEFQERNYGKVNDWIKRNAGTGLLTGATIAGASLLPGPKPAIQRIKEKVMAPAPVKSTINDNNSIPLNKALKYIK